MAQLPSILFQFDEQTYVFRSVSDMECYINDAIITSRLRFSCLIAHYWARLGNIHQANIQKANKAEESLVSIEIIDLYHEAPVVLLPILMALSLIAVEIAHRPVDVSNPVNPFFQRNVHTVSFPQFDSAASWASVVSSK